MIVLAIDTASSLCAACLYDATIERELGRAVRDIGKGHAEHLMGVVEEAMKQAGTSFQDLGLIGVSVGPGSFTGVRVGVSAARGFALALKIPAAGVSTLEALAAEARCEFGGAAVLSALGAGRDEIYAAVHDASGMVVFGPAIIGLRNAMELLEAFDPVLAGSAARTIADAAPRKVRIGPVSATADIAVYARLAAAQGGAVEKPRPLYLRQADAKPQAGFVLPRREA